MENIKVGDLVMVIKPIPCCGYDKRIGMISTVEQIVERGMYCTICGHNFGTSTHTIVNGIGFSFDRLKKIPPLEEQDKIETKEELPCKV